MKTILITGIGGLTPRSIAKTDSVPKSVYSPSFFIFANLLIFNKIILILKNYKLGTCKYLHFAPPFP